MRRPLPWRTALTLGLAAALVLESQQVRPAGGGTTQLVNGSGAALAVNGTWLRVQAEATGNGNSPQDIRADSWGDGASNNVQELMAYAAAAGWNGSSFDRLRTSSADNSSKTGVLAVAANTGSYYEINSASSTSVKGGGGILHKIVVNTPAAGTIGVYDVAGGSCSGTPGSGKLALVTLTASSQPLTLTYDLKTSNGICVVTSAATDLTVVFE